MRLLVLSSEQLDITFLQYFPASPDPGRECVLSEKIILDNEAQTADLDLHNIPGHWCGDLQSSAQN